MCLFKKKKAEAKAPSAKKKPFDPRPDEFARAHGYCAFPRYLLMGKGWDGFTPEQRLRQLHKGVAAEWFFYAISCEQFHAALEAASAMRRLDLGEKWSGTVLSWWCRLTDAQRYEHARKYAGWVPEYGCRSRKWLSVHERYGRFMTDEELKADNYRRRTVLRAAVKLFDAEDNMMRALSA